MRDSAAVTYHFNQVMGIRDPPHVEEQLRITTYDITTLLKGPISLSFTMSYSWCICILWWP